MCSYTPKYADQLTLKQMHDQQISNQRRTHTVRSAFYVVSQSQSQTTSKRVRIYRLPFFVVTVVTLEVTCVVVQRFHRPIFSGN